jgi:hypothetical protein
MGKYINNYRGFVNESKLVDLASQYIDATEIDSAMPDSELMKKLVNKIKDEKGSKAADDFVMKAVSINSPIKEEACLECQEMMEPCPACKKHADEMHNLSEQTPPQQPTQNAQYMAAGTKFCFFGSCRVDIKVVDKATSQIITSKGAEGPDAAQVYPQVLKMVQDDLASKKITGVTLPTFEQLQDTSPKK